jgi:hypothetical protein
MPDNNEIPLNYEDCYDASTDAREAEESFGNTLGNWIFGDSAFQDVVTDYYASEAADAHAERICDFGEQSDGGSGNSYSLSLGF